MNIQKTLFFLFPLIMLISCAGNQPQQQSAEPDPLSKIIPVDTLIHKGKLANGLTYYIRKNAKPENRVELRLALNAGSILETDQQQGLAHLCEHMAFNGSKHFQKQELVDYLESIGMRFGADLNAYTSFDETVYMLQVPSDSSEILEKGFQVLQNWAQFVSYEAEEIDKERGVVIEEWRLGRGAGQRMRDKQLPIMLKDSRYAERLPIGKKAVLDTFKYETLRDFYKTWYHPALMAVVVVGDIQISEMEKLIHKYFDPLTNPEPLPERSIFEVPGHEETLFTIASDPEATNSSVSIYNIFKTKDVTTVRDYRESMAERLFTGMLNQRFHELSQTEDPPYIYGYAFRGAFVRTAQNYGMSAMVKSGGVARGLETLLTEAHRVQKFGFTESELKRQKKAVLRSLQKSFDERDKQESKRYASEFLRNFLQNEPMPGITYEYDLHKKLLPGITIEEVNALTANWAEAKNQVVVVSMPEKEGLTVPREGELKQVIANVTSKEIAAYSDDIVDLPLLAEIPKTGKIVAEKYFKDLNITEWILQNGIKVILKPTDFKNDEIRFTSFSPGGYSQVSTENLIPAQTASSIVPGNGFGLFTKIQLQKLLTGKVVQVIPGIGELTEALYGTASPQDLETMFQLAYLTFTAPRIDSTAYLSYVARNKAYYQNKDASPNEAFADSITVTFSSRHPRYKPFSLETINDFDLQKSFEFYKNRYADAGDFTFVFVGNFNLETMRPLVEMYFGGLPTTGRTETWKDQTFDYPKGKIENIFHRGLDQKSLNSITFSGDFEWNKDNVALLNSLTNALRIKLRERIREEKSGTYGIRIKNSSSHFPRERYTIEISFGCNPERYQELTDEIFSQIDSVQQFGFDQVYLDKIQKNSQREFETSLKKNGFWLSGIRSAYFNNTDIKDILNGNERIQKQTLDMLQAAANKYLNSNNYVRVVMLPEEQD